MKAAEVKAGASEHNSQKDSEDASVVSDMPSPMTEAHNIKVENLQWQIQYEKKLHNEMCQLLENKVSKLMATQRELEHKIAGLEQSNLDKDKDHASLQEIIDGLHAKIKINHDAFVDL